MHAYMKDFILIKFTGHSVDILYNTNPAYEEQVVEEHDKRVLYLRLRKALYGCVMSALLWYELFAGTLRGIGFTINPYEPCIANKTINGKQCTITWYVDDVKVSHAEEAAVKDIMGKISRR